MKNERQFGDSKSGDTDRFLRNTKEWKTKGLDATKSNIKTAHVCIDDIREYVIR